MQETAHASNGSEVADKFSRAISFIGAMHSDRELDIVIRRLRGETYDTICKDHNVSRERVRQIVMRFRRKLLWWKSQLKNRRTEL